MELQERETGRVRYDDFYDKVDLACRETGEIKPYAVSHNKEYVIEAKVAVVFWANKAQLPEVRKIAERKLKHLLYEGIHRELHNLNLALWGGDRKAALEAGKKIEDLIS